MHADKTKVLCNSIYFLKKYGTCRINAENKLEQFKKRVQSCQTLIEVWLWATPPHTTRGFLLWILELKFRTLESELDCKTWGLVVVKVWGMLLVRKTPLPLPTVLDPSEYPVHHLPFSARYLIGRKRCYTRSNFHKNEVRSKQLFSALNRTEGIFLSTKTSSVQKVSSFITNLQQVMFSAIDLAWHTLPSPTEAI